MLGMVSITPITVDRYIIEIENSKYVYMNIVLQATSGADIRGG